MPPMPFAYVAVLTSLSASTTYYVRVFLVNGTGVHYGNEVTFTTLAAAPPTLDAPTFTPPSDSKIFILK